MMPYYPEEEDPNQPEWQLVISFCCQGMIEGVIMLLLLWLLIQVLFVSNLEGKILDIHFPSLHTHTLLSICKIMCMWALGQITSLPLKISAVPSLVGEGDHLQMSCEQPLNQLIKLQQHC